MTELENGVAHAPQPEVVIQVPITPTTATNNSEGANSGIDNPANLKQAAHSPSGSVSSVLSSESTKKLIKSLSFGNLDASKENNNSSEPTGAEPTLLPVSPTVASALPKPGNNPKPIKFTVRKVSRDTISIPDSAQGKPRDYAYGNIPENREKARERRSQEKTTQLQHSQQKYDEYAARIDKISKEVAFLTNLLPPYNVEIDYTTRAKITKAIEKLKMKQDEIEKKKYSLGITISRLWREHDENEIFVRSVSKQ